MEDKVRGMFVGLAIGDVLGAPVQFGCHSDYIVEKIEKLKNFHDNHTLPKGAWTDDTSMALCLADSLLECGGYDSYDVMKKYSDWETYGYRSYFEMGYDVGSQTDHAISRFEKNPVIKKDEAREWNAGNGSIMRLAPVIIASESSENAVKLAWVSGRETHYSEISEMGTQVFANILFRALHEKDKEKIISLENFYFTTEDLNETWLDNKWYISGRIIKENNGVCFRDLGGYVLDAVAIAIWAFRKFDDFEEGMIEVLKLGGDTDTNCAIYGQLAGAYYGLAKIPDRWKNEFSLTDEIVSLADQLHNKKPNQSLRTRFEEDPEFFAVV